MESYIKEKMLKYQFLTLLFFLVMEFGTPGPSGLLISSDNLLVSEELQTVINLSVVK